MSDRVEKIGQEFLEGMGQGQNEEDREKVESMCAMYGMTLGLASVFLQNLNNRLANGEQVREEDKSSLEALQPVLKKASNLFMEMAKEARDGA